VNKYDYIHSYFIFFLAPQWLLRLPAASRQRKTDGVLFGGIQEKGVAVKTATEGNLRMRARWMLAKTLHSNPAAAVHRKSG
jgi:hypothetical protein